MSASAIKNGKAPLLTEGGTARIVGYSANQNGLTGRVERIGCNTVFLRMVDGPYAGSLQPMRPQYCEGVSENGC